ncbi:DUF4149 domain-containing protein [Oculatella sp. LEGE 06141]|uniref:DUF4149 domain-containing protein n=1 Tax=Oculatella sp. LEGE 06141 TaxID=1828648 RepID=UPI00187F5ED6|nr:DUF4149 domain-containing protein [Oculatella sp. LEGE 06141]MBE9177702.1 DUF4149 domain-containing protein [Oculatella sp. LEGE 06141]
MFAIASSEFQRSKWQTIVTGTLAFWLSSSLLLDFVVMPGMYTAGMMTEPGFATAGYSIFWIFNRIELVCAAIALTGLLVLRTTRPTVNQLTAFALGLGLFLFAVSLIYTYGLTPEMSALGLQLDLFQPSAEVPAAMDQMHQEYWLLELLKLGASGALLGLCWNKQV